MALTALITFALLLAAETSISCVYRRWKCSAYSETSPPLLRYKGQLAGLSMSASTGG